MWSPIHNPYCLRSATCTSQHQKIPKAANNPTHMTNTYVKIMNRIVMSLKLCAAALITEWWNVMGAAPHSTGGGGGEQLPTSWAAIVLEVLKHWMRHRWIMAP